MIFFPIDPSLNLSIGERRVLSVSMWDGYAIFSAYLGKTECCGSGEFWTPCSLSIPLVHFLLKKASVAIMHIHSGTDNFWSPRVSLDDVCKAACVEGIFNITGKKINDGVLLFLEILDLGAYRTWRGV